MSPATGFQYTPPSYLVRASDTTNRPWSKTEEGNNQYTGDNDYDLAQEDRPQTRRQSHLDAHFQQRVRNKQSRYRTILSGEADLPEHSNASEEEEEDDSIIAAAKNADSFADIHSAKLSVLTASTNQMARKNRKERIKGKPSESKRDFSTASDAENARSLRAQRLRNSLLKQTPDDYDVQEKLEMRRAARRDEDAALRKAERDSLSNDPTFKNDTISTRKDLDKQRRAYEADQEVMALAKEEAALALLRAAELNEKRIRQRDRECLEEERSRRDRTQNKGSKKKNRHKSMRTKNYSGNNSTNTDGETFMTEFDAENDFAFLNDITGIVRDSGIMKTCGSCFGGAVGEGGDDDMNSFKVKTCTAISSVFVPDLAPCSDNSASDDGAVMNDVESIRRSREYARYRE
jgi:hypothetical protein